MTDIPREPTPSERTTPKRRTPPDVDKDDVDEIPQAGLPAEDVDLDTKPRR
jgi:hypothetical protein